MEEIHRRCLAGAIECCDEDPFPRASGHLDWIRWEIHPWHESTGDIGGIILFSEVITERIQHEQQVTHINRVLKAIRGVNQLITYEKDRETLLRRACEILVDMRGYRAAWIALRDEKGRLHAEAESGVGDVFASIGRALEHGQIPLCCEKALDNPEDIVTIRDTLQNCTVCPLAAIDDRTSAMAGVLHHEEREFGVLVVTLPENITDINDEWPLFKELIDDVGFALYGLDQEEKRKRAEARYKVLFESSSDGILIADIETRQMRYANPAICRLFGYTASEFESLQIADLHPEQELPEIISGFEAQARGDITLTPDIPCRRKDGSVAYADVNAAPIIIDGRRCLAGFFRDITARKKAETDRETLRGQLMQAQKMESVGRLAGGVAHDFNNILSIILGYTELALERKDCPKNCRATAGNLFLGHEIKGYYAAVAGLCPQADHRPPGARPELTIENMLKIMRRLIGEEIDLAWLPGARVVARFDGSVPDRSDHGQPVRKCTGCDF